jgi:hypothetical protein
MRDLYPAAFHLTGMQDFGTQVALDVDRPAKGEVPVLRNDANQFELSPPEEPAFRPDAFDQILRG